jgi:hypothetical protein
MRQAIRIELSPEVESALQDAARRKGVTPEALVISMLEEQLALPQPEDEAALRPRDEWEALVFQVGKDCDVSLSDRQLSSDGLYD